MNYFGGLFWDIGDKSDNGRFLKREEKNLSVQLIGILVILMLANQVIGTGYGSWKVGFSKALFWKGVKKIILLAVGYGTIALTVHFAADYIPKIEYLNGILLEPIAKYFTKVCDALKQLLNEPTKANDPAASAEPESAGVHQEEVPSK